METKDRRVRVCRRRMSIPPRETAGVPPWDRGDSKRDSSRDVIEDLPDPERPTRAVHESLGIVSEMSRRTRASGRDGYRKSSPVIVTGATREIFKSPLCSWDLPSGRFARRRSRAAISRDVLIWGTAGGLVPSMMRQDW